LSLQAKQPKEKFNVWKPFIYWHFQPSIFQPLLSILRTQRAPYVETYPGIEVKPTNGMEL